MMPKVAVQMLVGQNPEPFLPYAIRSVLWADYFTVVNTAPDHALGKENKEIASSELAGYDFRYAELETQESGRFSFADARNACLEMTDTNDVVLIVDSDDIHYPEWEDLVRSAISNGVDSITAHFYHLMIYKNVFQYVQPREIVYTNYEGTLWVNDVHEQLINKKTWPLVVDYHYMHYGYIKPQREIFDRWKFYSDLDGDFDHYKGQNPDCIVEDRISVSKQLQVPHPDVDGLHEYLAGLPVCPEYYLRPNNETMPVEKVGLILLTYNDEDHLRQMLPSLVNTARYPNYEVLALDMGSTDSSINLLQEYQESCSISIMRAEELLPLAETLNAGLDYFRIRHDIQYIGWIHPDMIFADPRWLQMLWKDLQEHPKIGKICAANTRVPLPEKLQPGQEQCFIIRKDVVNKVGLFDEAYQGIGGYEDWDYNRRILNHDGYRVMMSARAHVYHEGCGTRSKRDTSMDAIANYAYYGRKWGDTKCPV